MPSLPSKRKICYIKILKFSHVLIYYKKTRFRLKCFMNDCSSNAYNSKDRLYMHIYIYIYIYTHRSIDIYIYIYIYRYFHTPHLTLCKAEICKRVTCGYRKGNKVILTKWGVVSSHKKVTMGNFWKLFPKLIRYCCIELINKL